jgi:hypothetical protein
MVTIKHILIAFNCVSISLGLTVLLEIHKPPETVPSAITFAYHDKSKEVIVARLIEECQVADAVADVMQWALYLWLATAILNIVVLLASALVSRLFKVENEV